MNVYDLVLFVVGMILAALIVAGMIVALVMFVATRWPLSLWPPHRMLRILSCGGPRNQIDRKLVPYAEWIFRMVVVLLFAIMISGLLKLSLADSTKRSEDWIGLGLAMAFIYVWGFVFYHSFAAARPNPPSTRLGRVLSAFFLSGSAPDRPNAHRKRKRIGLAVAAIGTVILIICGLLVR